MRLLSFTTLPELRRVLPDRRARVLRLCLASTSGRLLLTLAVLLVGLNLAAGLVALLQFLRHALSAGPSIILAAGILYSSLACLLMHQLAARMVRKGLRRWLRVNSSPSPRDSARLIHTCPDCGYDQRGTRGQACPECGNSLLISRPPLQPVRKAA